MLSDEFKSHLCGKLIPFWKRLRDEQHGGYYGWMDSGLNVDREAVKGCILNSRILWFFSNAAMYLEKNGVSKRDVKEGTALSGRTEEKRAEDGRGDGTDSLRKYADWAYRFLREKCLDTEQGGVYWSLDNTGRPEDTTKHTYNQAFAVYALSSYFRAWHDREALMLAEELIEVIETKCFDAYGYKEALDRDFHPAANDKLSENGVMADHTMNTLLHVLEAYTEYLAACRETGAGTRERTVREKLCWILDMVAERVYNPALRRQEVFFNRNMESLIDLHSFGHDIEAAWLMDRCLETLEEDRLTERMRPILRSLEAEVYEKAFARHSLANECERGVVDEKRIWWVQAEGVVGFYNAYQKTGERRYLEAAEDIWGFIQEYLVDGRPEGEWFWYTDADGNPALEKPIVEPWKCPYHNGRMCLEIMGRCGEK